MFGFALIASGFSILRAVTHLSAVNIHRRILSIIIGLLFIYKIEMLSIVVSFQFYIISFIMMFVGIIGLFSDSKYPKSVLCLF